MMNYLNITIEFLVFLLLPRIRGLTFFFTTNPAF